MLNDYELLQIKGGAVSITGSLVDAITAAYEKIFEFGQSFGTSLRRLILKEPC